MKKLNTDYHSRFICEIQIPIEAYRDYINKSYNLLILEAINQDTKIDIFLSEACEFEKEEYYISPDSIKDDLNSEIIQLWHSSIFLSLCSLLEKWLKMWIEIHYNIKNPKWRKFDKIIDSLKKEEINRGKALIEILYDYYINDLGIKPRKNHHIQASKTMLFYYKIRNSVTHKEGSLLDIKIYSKDKLISISYEIESFLECIYYWSNSNDLFDEIF